MSRVEEILQVADQVPPFPKVAQQVLKMLENPNTKAKALAEVIQYDAGITANLLKTCNAAYFGLTRKVSSLEDALVVMGHDMLKDIVMASSSASFYKGSAGQGYLLEDGDLWKHSVGVAIMAKSLSRCFPGVKENIAFTAGLLHDIGKGFISSFVADDFQKIMAMAHGGGSSFIEAERQILGVDHAELGGMIIKKWEFDQGMVEAVRQHHAPDALDKGELTALVAISNTLVISMGIGVGADGLAGALEGESLGRFNIDNKTLDTAMSELVFDLEKAEDLINLSR